MLETFKKKMLFNIKRSLAVIIDVTAIALISGSLSVSPLNPHYEKTYELQTEFEELTNQYLEEVERSFVSIIYCGFFKIDLRSNDLHCLYVFILCTLRILLRWANSREEIDEIENSDCRRR